MIIRICNATLNLIYLINCLFILKKLTFVSVILLLQSEMGLGWQISLHWKYEQRGWCGFSSSKENSYDVRKPTHVCHSLQIRYKLLRGWDACRSYKWRPALRLDITLGCLFNLTALVYGIKLLYFLILDCFMSYSISYEL